MARVTLSGSSNQRAGGPGVIDVSGDTAGAVVTALEQVHPALKGWIVDEQGVLRRHVKLFLGGVAVPLEAPVVPGDELHIVGAISGG